MLLVIISNFDIFSSEYELLDIYFINILYHFNNSPSFNNIILVLCGIMDVSKENFKNLENIIE